MLVHSTVADLPVYLYSFLKNFNMQSGGQMQPRFIRCRKNKQGRVVIKYVDDKIVGWALVWPDVWTKQDVVYFYVDPQERRKGYGKEIADALPEKMQVVPWDGCSREFFRSIGCEVNGYENSWKPAQLTNA